MLWLVSLTLVAVVGLLGWKWYQFDRVVQVENYRKLEWRDLKAAEAILLRGKIPNAWLGGVFISNDAIGRFLKLQEGSTATISGIKDFEDLSLEVKHFSLTSKTGPADVSFELAAKSQKNGVVLDLVAEAVTAFKRTEMRGDPIRPHAILSLVITSIRPAFHWKGMTLSAPDALRSLVAAGIMQRLSDKLEFPLALSETFELNLGDPPGPERSEYAVRKGTYKVKDTGTIDYEFTYKNTDLKYAIQFGVPLFSDKGIWVLADDKPFVVPDQVPIATPSKEEIGALRSNVERLLSANATRPTTDVSLFVHGRTLQLVVSKFSDLPIEQRTVKFKATKPTGQFWKDGLNYVDALKDNFAEGSAVVAPLTVGWTPSKGVNFSSSLAASVAADIHWHAGVVSYGREVSVKGAAQSPVKGVLGIGTLAIDDISMVVLIPEIDCIQVPVEVVASGDIEVRIKKGLVFPVTRTPMALLDTIPLRIDLTSKLPDSRRAVDVIAVKPNWKVPIVSVVTRPTEAFATTDGVTASAQIEYAPAGAGADPTAALRRGRDAHLKTYGESLAPALCPAPEDLFVSVAGVIDNNPNAAIPKAISDLKDALDRVQKEQAKIANNPIQAVKDLPGNVVREVGKGIESIGQALGKLF